jgi:hypothetical protein
MKEVKEP